MTNSDRQSFLDRIRVSRQELNKNNNNNQSNSEDNTEEAGPDKGQPRARPCSRDAGGQNRTQSSRGK